MAVAVVHSHHLKGKEPAVLAGGLGLLGASMLMPVFWNRGMTPIPPCLFHTITGQPCPFCGATRSFVWTAQGHLGAAFQVFPIGPVMFLAMVLAVGYCAWAIVTGKRIRISVPWRMEQAFYLSLLLILAANWVSKLLFLGFGPSPFPRRLIPEPTDRAELEAALHRYLDLLLERNRSTNLTAVRDPAVAWEKLILESLAVLDAHPFAGDERVVDVGSGGGLPGLPVTLALPGLRMTLVESDQRKASFLRDAVGALGLSSVVVEARRAEEVGRDPGHREGYDVALTRAAAKAPVAAEYCLPLVRQGGVLLAQARVADWRAAARAVGQLGGRIRGDVGGTVVVEKVRPTPGAYPRRPGVPGKKPL